MSDEDKPVDTTSQPSGQPLPEETPASVDVVAAATLAAQRLEEANRVTAELLGRQEALRVEQTLGGRSETSLPSLSDEEKKDKNAKDFLAGTGFAEELFPDKE